MAKKQKTFRPKPRKPRGFRDRIGADILAEAPIGAVTSVAGEQGLALIRTDRLAKAGQAGTPLTCNGKPVTFDLSDWQRAEVDAHLEETADD